MGAPKIGYRLQVAGCREEIVGDLELLAIRLSMGTIRKFEEFEVWRIGREITRQVYQITKTNGFIRDYELRSQICRASISIMSNIAEGHESQTPKTFIRHLGIAKGSAGELRSQLYVALDQNYISSDEFTALAELCTKASRQIAALIKYLKSHHAPA